MAESHHDQQFLEMVVKAIVNKPELVNVTREVDELGVLLMLHVDPSDSRVVAIRVEMRVIGGAGEVTMTAFEQHFQHIPAIGAIIVIFRRAVINFNRMSGSK